MKITKQFESTSPAWVIGIKHRDLYRELCVCDNEDVADALIDVLQGALELNQEVKNAVESPPSNPSRFMRGFAAGVRNAGYIVEGFKLEGLL